MKRHSQSMLTPLTVIFFKERHSFQYPLDGYKYLMNSLLKNKQTIRKVLKTMFKPLALTGMVFLISQSPAFAAETEVAETFDINIQTDCPDITNLPDDKKQVKAFNHAAHIKNIVGKSDFSTHAFSDEFTCAACHPGAADTAAIIDAEQCNRLSTAVEAGGGGKKYKKYIHGICIDCHKSMKKGGEATGPTSCKKCHIGK